MPTAIAQKRAAIMDEAILLQQPPIVTIDTARLELKTAQMSDLDDIMNFITLKEVMQWTSQGPVSTCDQGERWLKDRALGPDTFNFAIRERDSSGTVKPRVIGLLGSFHWPSCGYMIDPGFAGKGYATEALKAFIPAYFERVPPASEGGTGHDILDGYTDTENLPSQKILAKCGFTRGETMYGEIENTMGVRNTIVWRIARPGKTLEELGFAKKADEKDEPPEPPVQ